MCGGRGDARFWILVRLRPCLAKTDKAASRVPDWSSKSNAIPTLFRGVAMGWAGYTDVVNGRMNDADVHDGRSRLNCASNMPYILERERYVAGKA